MPILPGGVLTAPSAATIAPVHGPAESYSTGGARGRRHFAENSAALGLAAPAAPIFTASKARMGYEPDYPRPGGVKRLEPVYLQSGGGGLLPGHGGEEGASSAVDLHGTRKLFPHLTNMESLREGGLVDCSPRPGHGTGRGPVLDASTGRPVGSRRGVETDPIAAVYGHLQRHPERDHETVVSTMRGGLGYSVGGDKTYRVPEKSNQFYSGGAELQGADMHGGGKPAKWYADPEGRRPRVAMASAATSGNTASARPLWQR